MIPSLFHVWPGPACSRTTLHTNPCLSTLHPDSTTLFQVQARVTAETSNPLCVLCSSNGVYYSTNHPRLISRAHKKGISNMRLTKKEEENAVEISQVNTLEKSCLGSLFIWPIIPLYRWVFKKKQIYKQVHSNWVPKTLFLSKCFFGMFSQYINIGRKLQPHLNEKNTWSLINQAKNLSQIAAECFVTVNLGCQLKEERIWSEKLLPSDWPMIIPVGC